MKKQWLLKPEFQELWERIKHKTRYMVKIDSQKLLADVLEELNQKEIREPHITVGKARVEVEGEQFVSIHVAEREAPYQAEKKLQANLTEIMSSLLERTTPPMRLTRKTLLDIFLQSRPEIQRAALENPFEFASIAVQIIKEKLADQLIDGIQYEKINEWYEMTQFEDIPSWEDNLIPAKNSIYDHVVYESDTVEREFVLGLEHRDDVKLYVKLPRWFTIPTPVGEYNPDWAIVLEGRDEHGDKTEDMLYLVRETKSTRNLDDLRPDERRKIQSGKRHFKDALDVDFEVVTNTKEL